VKGGLGRSRECFSKLRFITDTMIRGKKGDYRVRILLKGDGCGKYRARRCVAANRFSDHLVFRKIQNLTDFSGVIFGGDDKDPGFRDKRREAAGRFFKQGPLPENGKKLFGFFAAALRPKPGSGTACHNDRP
jgi:hypothetical protein